MVHSIKTWLSIKEETFILNVDVSSFSIPWRLTLHFSSTLSNGDITASSVNETPREKHISIRLQQSVPAASIPGQIKCKLCFQIFQC